MRDTLYLLLIMSALNIGKNLIILYSISFLVSVIITDVQGQSYIETMKKNIAHLQCYEGIDLKVKARSCPAYSVTCSKVTICLDNDCKNTEERRFCGPIQRGSRFYKPAEYCNKHNVPFRHTYCSCYKDLCNK
eukprot:12977.XXX_387641_386980_1 [CDS] Oithona nana genome sequencing.